MMSSNVENIGNTIRVVFINPDGSRAIAMVKPGATILDAARIADVKLEGACDGCCACSTCHVIVAKEWFSKLAPISSQEEDMLDVAFGVVSTSRLGCQIKLDKELDGIELRIPSGTVNL